MSNLNWAKFTSAELRRRWFEANGFSIEDAGAVSKCRNRVWRFDGDLLAVRCA